MLGCSNRLWLFSFKFQMSNETATVEFNEEAFVRSMQYQPVDIVIIVVSMNFNYKYNLKFYILVREIFNRTSSFNCSRKVSRSYW
jgi:hypothetical protein